MSAESVISRNHLFFQDFIAISFRLFPTLLRSRSKRPGSSRSAEQPSKKAAAVNSIRTKQQQVGSRQMAGSLGFDVI
jgi:hypothetical protein